MLRKILGILLFTGVLLGQLFTLQRCANPLPPKGGPRDSLGPVLIQEESTPGFQTNFRPDRIVLTFDEWVQLKDPTQIVVSPPVDPLPKVSLKKKSLVIDFGAAVLRDSATYVINIGEAIVDLTESNPPENLRFVFATGPVLDSASVRGRLVDAYTGVAVEKAIFALYENLADTAVSTENPFYFARSDENGLFEISNIRPGTYRGIALDNGGLGGYQLDERSTKQIGFPDSLLVLPDSSIELGDIRMSPLARRLRLLEKDSSRFGALSIVFDRPAEDVLLRSTQDYLRINERDTLRLFYRENLGDTLFFGTNTLGFTDTFLLNTVTDNRAIFKGALRLRKGPPGSLSPLEVPAFRFNRPLSQVDLSLLTVTKDTLPQPIPAESSIDSTELGLLRILANYGQGNTYNFRLLPGAVTDIFGQSNPDTIETTTRIINANTLGTLTLQLRNLDPAQQYVLRLIKGKAETPTATLIVRDVEAADRSLAGLEPATYQLEIITDLNRNGRYDGASYADKRQAEPVRIVTLEKLRADWEVEALIDLSSI